MKIANIKIYWTVFSALLIFALVCTLIPQNTKAVSAGDWKPGRIIDDAVFFNKDAMNVGQIQSFLNSKVPVCDTNHQAFFWSGGVYNAPPYTCLKDYNEGGKSSAQIIWEAAQTYSINPQTLIVMLQKESALVTDTWAAPWQYKTAMGYGCPDTADCDSKYFGFTNQVNNAAWQLRAYVNNPNGYNFKAGVTRNIQWSPNGACGSSPVYIENSATAALYNYTPYQPNQAALNNLYGTGDGCSAYGNRNFWRMFNDWFGNSSVNTPYAWQYINQIAYLDPERTQLLTGETTVSPGNKIYLRVQAKNAGTTTWTKNTINLGTSKPNDRLSLFASSDWMNPYRPATMNETSVTTGNTATFDFEAVAPNTDGTYKEFFNIVADGVTWFNDPGLYFNINVVSPRPVLADPMQLASGQSIDLGKHIISSDGKSVLKLNIDGNLGLYFDFGNAVWSSMTPNSAGAKLVMQSDGNLVLYSSTGSPIWNTGTSGNTGAKLVMQSDGNLVLYSSTGSPIWDTGTIHKPEFQSYVNTYLTQAKLYPTQSLDTANRNYKLILQSDGNLVLYSKGTPIWSSGTTGKPVSFLSAQDDGNLVLYDNQNRPLWYSNTSGSGSHNRLVVQSDGNLVLYNKSMAPLWHSQTSGR